MKLILLEKEKKKKKKRLVEINEAMTRVCAIVMQRCKRTKGRFRETFDFWRKKKSSIFDDSSTIDPPH